MSGENAGGAEGQGGAEGKVFPEGGEQGGEGEGKPTEGGEGKPTEGKGEGEGEGEGDGPFGKEGAEAEGEGEPKGEKPQLPEKYELKDAEGKVLELPEAEAQRVDKLFRDLGLSQEQAQKLATYDLERAAAFEGNQIKELAQYKADLLQQSKADKEIGGPEFSASARFANQVFGKWGTPALAKLLKETGMANHPEILRVFSRVGRAIGEEGLRGKGRKDTPSESEAAELRKLYPSMYNEDGTPKSATG